MSRPMSFFGMTAVAVLLGMAGGSLNANTGEENDIALSGEAIQIQPGFDVELVYSVPYEEQGSWVCLTVDPVGRLITSDENGILYRVTPPPTGEPGEPDVEPIEVWVTDENNERVGEHPVGQAQGLHYAFDSLYVMVNRSDDVAEGSGLYRLRDTNSDDTFDHAERILALDGFGEHGPHAVKPGPDDQWLYVIAGNNTQLPEPNTALVPKTWDEDLLLERLWDPRSRWLSNRAPGGWIARIAPDGTRFQVHTIGLRNAYDFDFSRHGDLFTFDSDSEVDIGMPWYRPIRVLHATRGSEFGWRTGSGNWPPHYPDSLPAVHDVGVGSPTGVTFAYDAAFPAKYQNALFLADWSFGRLYAMHMEADGASYKAVDLEPFASAAPLPITGLHVRPADGALYFTVGGRGTQSGVYRIIYTGDEPTDPLEIGNRDMPIEDPQAAELHELRRELEAFHGQEDAQAVETAWPHLSHEDRFIRYAARIAIEHQPVGQWQERALEASDPQALIEAMVALARHGDPTLQQKLVQALNSLEYTSLTPGQRLAFLRAYQLVFIRMGEPDSETREQAVAHLGPLYPAGRVREDRELSRLAIYLEMPNAVERTLERLRTAASTEEQIHYAAVLRHARSGWNRELRRAYFSWFPTVAGVHGGAGIQGYIDNIKEEALEKLDEGQQDALAEILADTGQDKAAPGIAEPREFQRNWSIDELVEAVEGEDLHGRDYQNGRRMFGAAQCFACHRMAGEGGSGGPDLTGVANRYSVRDLATKLVDPSRNVADQYANTVFHLKDGSRVIGQITDIHPGAGLAVITDPRAPGEYVHIDPSEIEKQELSLHSPMPPGLADTLSKEEVRDLFAYLLAGGDSEHELFDEE